MRLPEFRSGLLRFLYTMNKIQNATRTANEMTGISSRELIAYTIFSA